MPIDDEVVVRPASPEDAEPICAIYNAALAERGSTFETEPREAADFARRIDGAWRDVLVVERLLAIS